MAARRAYVVTALFASLLGAAACGGSSGGSGSNGDTVKIGLEGPITGDQSSNGVDMLRAAQLAVGAVDADGGVLGKKVEVVPLDDKADPSMAVTVADDAISQHVVAVIGPYNSSVGVKNLKRYVDAGVIPIHLTSDSATNGLGYTVQPKDYQIAPVEATAIAGYFKVHNVAILYDPSTYTQGIASRLRTDLGHKGVHVVSYLRINPSKKTFASQVQQAAAKHPDLVYASTYYPQGGVIAKELAQQHVGATCLMGLANQDPGFVGVSGVAAARRCSFSGVPSAAQFPAAGAYVAAYTARYHAQPGTWGTFTYDSVDLLFDAVRRAGTWNADAVKQQLSATQDYAGLTGSIAIDPSTGNRVKIPVVILTVGAGGAYSVDPRWAAFAHFSG